MNTGRVAEVDGHSSPQIRDNGKRKLFIEENRKSRIWKEEERDSHLKQVGSQEIPNINVTLKCLALDFVIGRKNKK